MYLSKSDFLKYQCCPSYLWLWKYKKEVVPVDDEEEINRRLEQGNEVERYARGLFPNAVLVDSHGKKARNETEQLVSDGVKTIFQATVYTDKELLAMADIVEFDEATQSWTLYEVKSTNSVKKEHIYDLAFQCVAFEDAGYKIGKVGVIHLDKTYIRKTVVEPNHLLTQTDVTEKVEKVLPVIREQAYDAVEMLKQTDEPTKCSCRLKTKSGHCPTFNYLNPDIPEYSVFNISRIGGKNLAVLVDGDIHNVHDVPEDIKLSIGQQNQVKVAKSKEPIINKPAIKELLSELEYPLYFLDYETVSSALPMFNGCTPFQQIPFQYSLHVLREPNGELEHYDYLGRDSVKAPMPELLASLQSHLGDTGSVIAWYKVFEKGRNTEMANSYPEYAKFLNGVNNRVFDLMDVFSKQHYVHHDFKGSSSIKYVLPVLVPEFSYKDMDIQNGLVASIRWYDAVMGVADEVQTNKTFDDLLKYCCLDTLAMVKIYEYLKNI
ncbi:MAG: DUF2779 domain-containing protein [Candidatus Saccharimonadales bacterium]